MKVCRMESLKNLFIIVPPTAARVHFGFSIQKCFNLKTRVFRGKVGLSKIETFGLFPRRLCGTGTLEIRLGRKVWFNV